MGYISYAREAVTTIGQQLVATLELSRVCQARKRLFLKVELSKWLQQTTKNDGLMRRPTALRSLKILKCNPLNLVHTVLLIIQSFVSSTGNLVHSPSKCLLPFGLYGVKWPQQKQACHSHDDNTPMSFQLHVTEDFFKSHISSFVCFFDIKKPQKDRAFTKSRTLFLRSVFQKHEGKNYNIIMSNNYNAATTPSTLSKQRVYLNTYVVKIDVYLPKY